MVGVVVAGSMAEDQRRAELPQKFDDPLAGRRVVRQRAVAEFAEHQLGAEKCGGRLHLAPADVGQFGNQVRGLAAVAPAQHADSDRRPVPRRPRQRSRTQQFGVVWMGDDGEDAFVGEVQPHVRLTCGREVR